DESPDSEEPESSVEGSGLDESPDSEEPESSVEGSGLDESPDSEELFAAAGKKKPRSIFAELPILVAIALLLAVLVKTLAFQAFYIPSESMVETLQVNDRVLVNKISYRLGDPQRGDVVVFDRTPDTDESLVGALFRNLGESIGVRTPEADLIKRVIGLPGETIEIRQNTVFVDGVAIDEPYLEEGIRTTRMEPVTVPDDSYFVMGDNRPRSLDSRSFGTINRDEIVGKAFVIIWPTSRWGGL
ncbi:MAG: signal peptidase I, partial [bacterium]|nr:signal peptidase I [bacterium]